MAMYALSSGRPPTIRVESIWKIPTHPLLFVYRAGVIFMPVFLVNPLVAEGSLCTLPAGLR